MASDCELRITVNILKNTSIQNLGVFQNSAVSYGEREGTSTLTSICRSFRKDIVSVSMLVQRIPVITNLKKRFIN